MKQQKINSASNCNEGINKYCKFGYIETTGKNQYPRRNREYFIYLFQINIKEKGKKKVLRWVRLKRLSKKMVKRSEFNKRKIFVKIF